MMTKLERQYYIWICSQVSCGPQYDKLMRRLYATDFYYILPMDANRVDDGIELRYKFGDENRVTQAQICNELDTKQCSVLEMMAALALRCEDNIMGDPKFGDRTGAWFQHMLQNLGLITMTNPYYNELYVDSVIKRLLERSYDFDGAGGLFIVRHPQDDMRAVDIWTQLNWYLDDLVEEGI